MKKKLILCAAALIAVVISFVAYISFNPQSTRYHQHQSAQVKAECIHKNSEFCTHLPIVIINTQGNDFYNKEKLPCQLTIIDNTEKNNHLMDEAAILTNAQINLRGNTSYYFDKKQYRLNLLSDDGTSRDLSVMGMPKESNWVLHGPYMDKSLIRSYMMYNLSGEIMQWAPRVRFCEVFVTDGEDVSDADFKGLYVMTEAVTAGENRVDIKVGLLDSRQTGYIICREPPRLDNINADTFSAYTNHADHELAITYPVALKLTEGNIDYIERDVSRFERSIYSLDYDHVTDGFASQINVASFVDYFIINEFSINRDAGFVSTYTHKNLRGDIMMGPVWDFNNCFDNYIKASNLHDFHMVLSPWFGMLLKDESFVEKVIARYVELRKGVLSEEYVIRYIDETVEYLGDAIDRNYDLWGYIFDYQMTKAENGNPKDHQEAIATLKGKVKERGDWLDKNIYLLRQFCAESKVKPYN